MQNNIFKILEQTINNEYHKVVLCIGTSNCIGDSLGPRVGEILSKKIKNDRITIFGNLKENVNYRNINNILNRIYQEKNNPYIIIVDSALSEKKYIGKIIINKKSMIIGSALNKKNNLIGNISIKGIVGEDNKNSITNFYCLNNVSEKIVNELSNNIAEQIIKIL